MDEAPQVALPRKRRRWWIPALAALAVAAVGVTAWVVVRDTSGLDAELRGRADEFWSSRNDIQREFLCSEMDTPAGKLRAYEVVEDALFERQMEEARERNAEDVLDLLYAARADVSEKRRADAAATVEYLHGKC